MRRLTSFLLPLALAACGAPSPIQIGGDAPDFTAVDLATGKSIDFRTAYAGSVTLVNIWATWCGPCKEEIPALDSLYRALEPQGFRLAAVSIDTDDSTQVRKFIDQYHVAFDVLHDQDGTIQQIYQTTGVPESFLVDRHGKLLRIVYGAAPWTSASNRRIVEQLLEEQRVAAR